MPTLALIENGGLELRNEADQSLATLQRLVRGYIEPVFTLPSVTRDGISLTGYANDEGAITGMEPNVWCPPHAWPIYGPIVITGLDERTGETVELTPSEREQITLVTVKQSRLPILRIITAGVGSNRAA